MPPTLTTRDLNRALLARQMLLAREKVKVKRAVEHLVGLQAQIPKPPFIGLWTRLEKFSRDDLVKPLIRRELVRAPAMRFTIHVMTSEDYVRLRGALHAMLTRSASSMLKDRLGEWDSGALEREARAFFAGAPATFDQFRNHLKAIRPKADDRVVAYAVRAHVPLVQVPADLNWGFPAAASFALADEWLGRTIPLDNSSPRELVLRYLAAFGPATPADAQVWSGVQGLRPVFDELRAGLVTFRGTGERELFDLPDAPRPAADVPAPVRFLPDYDNVLLAHADRSRIIADEHRPRVTSANLQIRPTFLVDGMVAGTWRTERKKNVARLLLEPFTRFTRSTTAQLEAEGQRLLEFLEGDADHRVVSHVASRAGR